MVEFKFTDSNTNKYIVFVTDSFGDGDEFVITDIKNSKPSDFIMDFELGQNYRRMEMVNFSTDNGLILEIYDSNIKKESYYPQNEDFGNLNEDFGNLNESF